MMFLFLSWAGVLQLACSQDSVEVLLRHVRGKWNCISQATPSLLGSKECRNSGSEFVPQLPFQVSPQD